MFKWIVYLIFKLITAILLIIILYSLLAYISFANRRIVASLQRRGRSPFISRLLLDMFKFLLKELILVMSLLYSLNFLFHFQQLGAFIIIYFILIF